MGWFERYTLLCVVLVITSLSCILIASVELLHRLDERINEENMVLLRRFDTLRAQEELLPLLTEHPTNAPRPPRPLLAVIVRSSKLDYALRKTIRRTWAQHDHRLVHKFVLTVPTSDPPSIEAWLHRLKRRGTIKSARYFLLVEDTVFVNTRLLLPALESTLPTKEFVLCKPKDSAPPNETICDATHPVLLSGDVVRRGGASLPAAHNMHRLYLRRRDTEAILNQHIVDIRRLVYFFSAPLDCLPSIVSMAPALLMDRLWEAVGGKFSPVEA